MARLVFVTCLFSASVSAQAVTLASTFGAPGTPIQNIGWGAGYPASLAYPFTVPSGANYVFQSATLALLSGGGVPWPRSGAYPCRGHQRSSRFPGGFSFSTGSLRVEPEQHCPTDLHLYPASPFARRLCVLAGCFRHHQLRCRQDTTNVSPTPNLKASQPFGGSLWTVSTAPSVPGAFSVTGVLAAPSLSSPLNNAPGISITPTLSWNLSPHATSYDVYLGTSPGSLAKAGSVTGSSYTSLALQPNQTYWWQVAANDSLGPNPSLGTWSFSTGTHQPGQVIAPTSVDTTASGVAYQAYSFTFGDSAGASDLAVLDVLINDYLDGQHACYFAFTPSGPSSGYIYLVDDAGDGGYVSGSPGAARLSGEFTRQSV